MNIIKNVEQDGRGERDEGDELVELIEDLHGQYQSLYSFYDNLRTELRKKVHERKEDDSSSTSYGSDSESFYSSKEVDSNNGKHLEHELQKQIAHLKQDLEAANSEATTMDENKALTDGEYEASARIEELENQVTNLQLELESALARERSLEERIERAAAEAKETFEEISGLRGRISELELTSKEKDENEIKHQMNSLQVELNSLQTSKIQVENRNKELQTKISEQDETMNRMNQQCKQVKVLRRQSKMNLQSTERKVEEIAQQFRKSMEDNLRLMAQRIRVAEKLHYENRDFYRTTQDALRVEQRELQEKVAAHKAEFRKLELALTMTSDAVNGFDLVAERLSDSSEIFLNRILKISEELLSARNWMKGAKDEIKELKGEKLNLEERVGELEKIVKDRDERVIDLGEEKREAIRQLCICIDYHRADLHSLKILAKTSSRRPTTTT